MSYSWVELQNRIYEYAIEITAKTWPEIPSHNLCKRKRKSSSINEVPDKPRLSFSSFPFLGLTQTCTTIRVAFRGWWMENHRIPLCELERYLSAFHPLYATLGTKYICLPPGTNVTCCFVLPSTFQEQADLYSRF